MTRNQDLNVFNLKDALAESRFLWELFEVLGVGIVVEREVGPEDAQLVMFERRPKSLLSRRRRVTGAALVAVWRPPRHSLRSVTAFHITSNNNDTQSSTSSDPSAVAVSRIRRIFYYRRKSAEK